MLRKLLRWNLLLGLAMLWLLSAGLLLGVAGTTDPARRVKW